MILDQTIFPCVSYVEMGLAAGLLTGSRDTMVELVGVKFVQQYTISAGLKMMSTHNFGSGMQFVELSLESNNESVVCSISEINKNQVRTTPTESLNNIKTHHIHIPGRGINNIHMTVSEKMRPLRVRLCNL